VGRAAAIEAKESPGEVIKEDDYFILWKRYPKERKKFIFIVSCSCLSGLLTLFSSSDVHRQKDDERPSSLIARGMREYY
jgi:hypothetical protein